jgi:tetratricopeptide (TPR) repeat protein/serine phosphatase RsbU (regulator of sigma subunit)
MRKTACIVLLLLSCCLFSQTKETRDIDSLKQLIRTEKSAKRLAFLNDKLAREYMDIKDDSIEKYARISLSFSEKDGNYEYQVDAWNTLGMANRKKGNFEEALGYHFKALKLAQLHKLSNHYFYTSYSALCLAYTEQGNYTPAIEYGYKCLQATEVEKDTLHMAIVNNNLANIFFKVNNYEKALLHYKKALSIATLLGNTYGQALITSNIGSVYYQWGKLDSAKNYFDRSLVIDEQIEDVSGAATNYLNIGCYYQKKKQYAAAIERFFKAEKIFKELEMEPNLADIYFNLADVNYDLGNYPLAKTYGEQSLAIANKINGLSQKESAYFVLSRIYEKLHNIPSAYESYKNYIAIRDSISSDENKEQQFKAGLEYEYVKRKLSDSLDQVLVTKMQKEALEQEKVKTQTQQKLTYMALVGCLIFLVLAVFIFKGYNDKKKANLIIVQQKSEVEYQKEIVEVKQKEILDSIHYANRIQTAVLTPDSFIKQLFPQHFILFKPKDIVSGDFYWAAEKNDKVYLAVCDSTGHGVPGAFMSLLNSGFLSEAINEKNILQPNEIFNYTRRRLVESISKEGQQDGFDGILLCLDKKTGSVTYSSANNAPVLISGNRIIEFPKDKMPVGKGERNEAFNLYTLHYSKGDTLYLYTDGYADQFGGDKGKKFKYRNLNELILSVSGLAFDGQRDKLLTVFENWKDKLEQVDDVCIIGIKL